MKVKYRFASSMQDLKAWKLLSAAAWAIIHLMLIDLLRPSSFMLRIFRTDVPDSSRLDVTISTVIAIRLWWTDRQI